MSDNLFFSPEEWQRVYGARPQPNPGTVDWQYQQQQAQPIAPTPTAPIQQTPLSVSPPPPRTQVRAIIDVQALFEDDYLPPYEEEAARKVYDALAGARGPWYPEIRSLVTKITIIGAERTPEPPEEVNPIEQLSHQFTELIATIRAENAVLHAQNGELHERLSRLEAQRTADRAEAQSSELSDLFGGNRGDGDDGSRPRTGAPRPDGRTVPAGSEPDPIRPAASDAHPDRNGDGLGVAGGDREGDQGGAEPDPVRPGRKAAAAKLNS